METKLAGILTDVFPVKTSPGGSTKVFWLKQPDTERYPQHWELQLTGENVKLLNGVEVGDRLECLVQVRGRKWKRNDSSEIILLKLNVQSLIVTERIRTGYGSLGSYAAKEQPGREKDTDRPGPVQTSLL